MSVVAALFVVACGLLIVAGVSKLVRPAAALATLRRLRLPASPTAARVVGLGELVLGAAAAFAGRALAPVVAALYLAFAAASVGAVRSGAPCGCFGIAETRTTPGHVLVDVVAAAVSLAMAVGTGPALSVLFDDQPLAGVPFVILTIAAVWLVYLALTWLPVASRAATPTPSFSMRARDEFVAGRT